MGSGYQQLARIRDTGAAGLAQNTDLFSLFHLLKEFRYGAVFRLMYNEPGIAVDLHFLP